MFKLEEWQKDVERNYWDNAAMTSRASAKYLAETYQELKRTLGELDLANK
jgi:tripartite-type tricarboxylate transporter receptor subunit TctC